MGYRFMSAAVRWLALSENPAVEKGENLMEIPYKEMDKIRGNRIAMIFQDALSSLNPVYTVGNQVVEAICIHQNVEKKEA